MAIVFKHKGDFKKTKRFLKRMSEEEYLKCLDKYGRKGVEALALATPRDSGKTAESWANSNVNKGVNIAIILQYGHGTRNGGYVQGRDYINPAIRPIFDQMAAEVWGEVTKE